jgi:hypothetical protein
MRQVACTALSAADDVARLGGKIDARQLYSASFQIIISDTDLDGNVIIQASNDNPPNGAMIESFTPTNWSDIPSATTVVTNGVPAAFFINLSNMSYTFVRAKLGTPGTPGTGTIVVKMNAQGF